MAKTRRFELKDGTSDKFWEISREGKSFSVRFGRTGTSGQAQTKSFGSEDAAAREYEKLVREKVKKGYAERGAASVAAPPAKAGLPPLLAAPPWEAERPERRAPTVLALEPIAVAPRIAWRPGEKDEILAERTDDESTPKSDKWTLKGKTWYEPHSFHRLTDATALRLWSTLPVQNWHRFKARDVFLTLARLELKWLPGLLAFAAHNALQSVEPLSRVCAPEVGPLMIGVLARLKASKARRAVQEWLVTFPEEAALTVIPIALGKLGRERTAASLALSILAARGHGDVVRTAARRYGTEAAEATEDALAVDPTREFPAKMPKMPRFWQTKKLPKLRLRNGRELPLPAVEILGVLLALSTVDEPHAALLEVAAELDRKSAAEFAWALFWEWGAKAGSPPEHAWAFHALAFLGNDETARQLAPLLREWPNSGAYARAVVGLDILARIGTDGALMQLHGISQKVKSKALQERAGELIESIAEERGLSAEELGDRLVPTLDLEFDGSRVLDFGPRQFRVGFDEQLRPYVKTGDGERLGDLPKPARGDAAAKAAEAIETWKALKKEARNVAALEVFRFEQAMCLRRRWSVADFEALILPHPLLRHLARRLVWGTCDATTHTLRSTFRVAEDGSYADDADRAVRALLSDARVGVPHRLEMDDALVARWSQLFGDYTILQPFPQLGREVHKPTAAEHKATSLDRVEGAMVSTGAVLGLAQRGWRRGVVMDGGHMETMEKSLPGRLHVKLELDPGVWVSAASQAPEQTLGEVRLCRDGKWGDPKLTFGGLDAIVFSEIVNDVLGLRR